MFQGSSGYAPETDNEEWDGYQTVSVTFGCSIKNNVILKNASEFQ